MRLIKLIQEMRALYHQKSKEFFKKYQRPKQSEESIMNTLEAKKIATIIGIDVNEIKQMSWFFELIAKIKLPQNYKRFLSDDKDEVIYLNQETHEQSTDHPSMTLLKILFYECLENNKSVYTFIEKQTKLLPFVEEKMLRQCIGLSSKRRDAEKVNLQRDENGKMVMSKLQRINPDIKSLLSARSYMLRMLVEKVFTRKQILGKGKRAAAYQNTINEVKKTMKQLQPDIDQQYEADEDLEKFQNIFMEAAYFYQIQYGNLEKIPKRVIHSKQYLESTPQNVLKNIFLLNIDKDNIELYWMARIMDCLPLPHNWSKKKGASFDSYTYEPEKLLFDIHPSYIYILNQINRFKSIFPNLGIIQQNYYYNMRQLTFFDFFERRYSVDMYAYIVKNTQKYGKKKQKKQLEKNEQVSDWMVLEGMKNSPINNFNLVLMKHIERFWNSLDFKTEPWSPSISPFGQVLWSSNINEKSMSFNPYRAKLTSIVNSEEQKLPQITDQLLKKQYQQKAEDQDDLRLNTELLIKERESFLEYYLTHDDKANPYPYELKSRFNQIDQKIYYEQVFVSPFELQKGLLEEGEQVPFWLQKCRAKKHTIDHTNLLLFNPEQYITIKQKIGEYALEMVGEHQPYLLEQTEKRINRISNSEELIKYLNYINDLDLRQQRKKEYRDSLKFDSDDSDIFGSDISQVEVNEQMDQESVHEVKISEHHESSEEEQIDNEIYIESEEEAQNVVRPIEVVVEEENKPEPPREEYEFLKDFKKKKYMRNWELQLASEEILQKKLKNQLARKMRKCRYKQGIISRKIKKQIFKGKKILQNEDILNSRAYNELTIKRLKRNMIITHLRTNLLPYLNSQERQEYCFEKVSEVQSQMCYSEITDYEEFISEMDQCDRSEVSQLISEEKARKRQQTKKNTQSEVHQQIEHEVTQDTIQLDPIYQIKPDLGADPVLKHFGSTDVINSFRKTFNQRVRPLDPQIAEAPELGRRSVISKVSSLKNLKNSESKYHSTPQVRHNSTVKIRSKVSIEPKISITKREGLGAIPSRYESKPFHRVCLDCTASHFLGKEAFLRKGDIIQMQARKTLLSKGRGLETYISKFY